jgi:hypothetical protein
MDGAAALAERLRQALADLAPLWAYAAAGVGLALGSWLMGRRVDPRPRKRPRRRAGVEPPGEPPGAGDA